MSDLHLEFGDLNLDPTPADALVLAGDVDLFTDGVTWADDVARSLGTPVVMIAGNHEFYPRKGHRGPTLGQTLNTLRRAADLTDGRVTFLERGVAFVEGVRFVGATLWTDFALFGDSAVGQLASARALNDFRLIRTGTDDRRLTTGDTVRIHEASLDFLGEALTARFDGPTVVVTHHAPSRRSVAERYDTDLVSAAYASNLDELVGASGAALWIHGHVHDSFDYVIGGTRVLCNPRGYVGGELNPNFDPNLTVEV